MWVVEKTCSGYAQARTRYDLDAESMLNDDRELNYNYRLGYGYGIEPWKSDLECWSGKTVFNSDSEGYGMGENLNPSSDCLSQSPHYHTVWNQ